LDRVAPAPRLGLRRRGGRVQAVRRRARALRRAPPPPGDGPRDQPLALRDVPRGGVRRLSRSKPRVRHADLPVLLFLSRDAVLGGQARGRPWYDDGKMMHKMNTFRDYIDVAEDLVRRGYTRPDRLVANGGSAGGLLMGAVVNMRPDLFRALVAEVPFVDVINTMLDASLPLTAQEWEQWGNPHVADQYAYMRQYSPYDNVEAKAYPWMLV